MAQHLGQRTLFPWISCCSLDQVLHKSGPRWRRLDCLGWTLKAHFIEHKISRVLSKHSTRSVLWWKDSRCHHPKSGSSTSVHNQSAKRPWSVDRLTLFESTVLCRQDSRKKRTLRHQKSWWCCYPSTSSKRPRCPIKLRWAGLKEFSTHRPQSLNCASDDLHWEIALSVFCLIHHFLIVRHHLVDRKRCSMLPR